MDQPQGDELINATPAQLEQLARTADPDRAHYLRTLALVRRHHGNLSAMARELTTQVDQPITRQGVTLRLRQLHLEEEADMLRGLDGVKGPRKSLVNGRPDATAEAAQIVQALATTRNADEAAAVLGIPRRTLFRRKTALGITADQIAAARGHR